MKIRNQLFLLSLAALGFGACSEDNPWASGRGEGKIDLQLSASADIKDALPIVRAGAPDLIAPDVSDFAIELKNLDTDEVRSWSTLEEFNAEKGFAVGSYKLTAYYGSVHEFGFYKPYFVGETNVTVLEGRESSAEVVAQLGNAMLSVEYTEAFKNYFQDYFVTVLNQGEGSFIFSSGESRPGFVAPGTISLNLNATNPFDLSDKDKKPISLARFAVQARHHYHVTIDVEGVSGVGEASLKVIFDDNVDHEDVTISLTEELFTTEGPKINPDGFADGAVVEALSGNDSPNPLKFDISCKGGIKSAKLTVGGDHNLPFREVELVNASAGTQAILEQNGVKVTGIFGNESEFACVNVTGLSKYLPEGNFPVSVSVTDQVDRITDPVTVNISTRPIVLRFIEGSAIYTTPSLTEKNIDATVFVSYNGLNPKDCIMFKNKCQFGDFKDCEVVSVEESTHTRAFEEKTYIFNLRLCDAQNSPVPMEMYFNGVKYGDTFSINVVEPDFSLEADAFAKYARLKVEAKDQAQMSTIVNNLKLKLNGSSINSSQLGINQEDGMIYLYGLQSDKVYSLEYKLTDKVGSVNSIGFRTEALETITNGDFSQTTEYINIDKLNSGGQYKAGVKSKCYNTEHLLVNEPKGWANLNSLTCYEGSTCKNTWFMVPSTYTETVQQNEKDIVAVVVRSVAYDHNGIEPAFKDWGTWNYTYYNPNLPATIASKASGELFLGSYNYDTSPSRVDGVTFNSRPSSVTFSYIYIPYGNEKGEAVIKLFAEDDSVVASVVSELVTHQSWYTQTLEFTYPEFGKRAVKLEISFKSTKGNSIGTWMPESGNVDNVSGVPGADGGHKLGINASKSLSTGSVLTISDIKFNY